jgi:NAD(P)-dependent dehydrogenase (short-subunit alcohol dehydrogenase family)
VSLKTLSFVLFPKLIVFVFSHSAIVYLPQEEKDAKDTQAYIKEKTGKEILLLPYDVKVEANCIKCVEETVEKFGRLDVLFNNAAQQLQNNDILTLDSKQWTDTFSVNCHSFFYCSKAAIPHLKKNKGSSIINNCSVNAFCGPYTFLKFPESLLTSLVLQDDPIY